MCAIMNSSTAAMDVNGAQTAMQLDVNDIVHFPQKEKHKRTHTHTHAQNSNNSNNKRNLSLEIAAQHTEIKTIKIK